MRSTLFVLVPLLAAACSNPTTNPGADAAADLSSAPRDLSVFVGGDGPPPDLAVRDLASPPDLILEPPVLGKLIDRMGRPAISNMMIDPLDWDGQRGAQQDAYNQSSLPVADAGVTDVAPLAAGLALYDILDGVCGNQPLFTKPNGGGFPYSSYNQLAALLADDQLYLTTVLPNQQVFACQKYLSLEYAFLGGMTPGDCGGRAPNFDVIDVTYTLLSGFGIGTISDGINSDQANPLSASFPFLAAPNN